MLWYDTEDEKLCAKIEASQELLQWVYIEGSGHYGRKKLVLGYE